MQRKINEKKKRRKVALIAIVSIALTFCFLANNYSTQILASNPENFNAEHENNFEALNSASPSNLDYIESIFDAKSANFSSNGYYAQIYSDSVQATYYALYVLNSIGKLSEINQTEVKSYLMSFYNSSSHQFVDSSAKRYLSSSIPGLYMPLTTLLEVNCYAVLSLDILNALSIIDVSETIDFIWNCYHPTLHGFIGQPYNVSLDDGFKIPTADNTYYAVITLDLLISDWSVYSQERDDIISFVDGLQSLGSHTGFFNDKNHLFDSLLEPEPNQFASFYAIKTLETFGSGYINVINVAKFHQDLTDLYHPADFYFDISSVGWVANYTNVVATAINLELSDLTGFIGFDRNKVIDFVINNRNAFGGWDASTTIKYHELIDTFQIVRSLANTGEISKLTQNDKNEIVDFIKFFSQLNGYSLLSEDYASVELIHAIISSYDYFDRIAELDIQELYNQLEESALYMGEEYYFFASTKLDPNIPGFRSRPFDYYTLGFHKLVDEINAIYSHKETYLILNSLQKIFKLNDFAASCDLNSVLQGVIDSQFLDPDYQENFGAFLYDNIGSSSEWKNQFVYMQYSFYAIKVMELITDYLGLGPITNLGFNKTALACYFSLPDNRKDHCEKERGKRKKKQYYHIRIANPYRINTGYDDNYGLLLKRRFFYDCKYLRGRWACNIARFFDKKLEVELSISIVNIIREEENLRKKILINSILKQFKSTYGKFMILSCIESECKRVFSKSKYFKILKLVQKLKFSKKMKFRILFPRIRYSIF